MTSVEIGILIAGIVILATVVAASLKWPAKPVGRIRVPCPCGCGMSVSELTAELVQSELDAGERTYKDQPDPDHLSDESIAADDEANR